MKTRRPDRPYYLGNSPASPAVHRNNSKALAASVAALAMLTGCVSSTSNESATMPLTASPARWPSRVTVGPQIAAALRCIHSSGVLRNVIFGVGPWVDSTGKGNSVATGATGAFLPQAGTASFVTDTIRRAGGQVLVQYFGPAEVKKRAHYSINGIFNSLDFGNNVNADVRVAGVGPTAMTGWAQLTLTVQMDVARTRMNRQTAVITRAVRYTQMGVTAGKIWSNVLVTGGVQFQDQQRLQFEAVNGPIAIGVIDVIAKEFPAVSRCREKTAAPHSDRRAASQRQMIGKPFRKEQHK